MSNVFNSEMEKSIKFGQYYCSPCAKAYDKNMVAKLSGATGIHINCPSCGHNIDVEFVSDEDDL